MCSRKQRDRKLSSDKRVVSSGYYQNLYQDVCVHHGEMKDKRKGSQVLTARVVVENVQVRHAERKPSPQKLSTQNLCIPSLNLVGQVVAMVMKRRV